MLIISVLFGAIIGAYTTTVDYRVRNDLPIVTADCYCPSCGHRLPLHHQFPVISWILLKGRCGFCNEAIPARYPVIEMGYTVFYTAAFCMFSAQPTVFCLLWFGFSCTVLCIRGRGHTKPLIKAIFHMTIYHGVIAATLIYLYAAKAPVI
ncbi:MAG: prepilin peptidase [Oscillospiraceae bacterium]|nr:prepilin peptidase [Oscillospiraceae bacterium]